MQEKAQAKLDKPLEKKVDDRDKMSAGEFDFLSRLV
jgi:hypothetical protein